MLMVPNLVALLLWRNRVALIVNEPLFAHHAQSVVNRVELWSRLAVRVKIVVGPGEILAVVACKVHVVKSMVGRTVDELFRPGAGDHVAVVDEDGPELHENEEYGVEVLLHRANKDKDMVRSRLQESIDGVESNRSPGRGNNPLVVRLVNVFVDAGVVFESVNPINEEVVEDHVYNGRDEEPGPAVLIDVRVEKTVAADLGEEKGQTEKIYDRNGPERRHDFLGDLVFEESRVVLQSTVEDQVVGKGGEDEVDCGGTKARDKQNRGALTSNIVARQRRDNARFDSRGGDFCGGVVRSNGAQQRRRRP